MLVPLVRRWRLIAAVSFAFAALAAIASMLMRPVFVASTTFTSQFRPLGASAGGLAGLAGRLGLSVDPASAAMSPDFLASVVQSRTILESAVQASYQLPVRTDEPATGTLAEWWDIQAENPQERLNRAVEALAGRLTVRVDIPTGIVTLSVRDRSPVVAAAIANRMVALLDAFNLERRQSQSREARRFASERLVPAESELRTAEAAHLRFLQANRNFRESSVLAFEENRLQRMVQLKQEIYATLIREFEEARIAEVRDTPLLTVIDSAAPPDKRFSPRRKRMVVLAALAGMALSILWIYGQAYLRYLRESGRTDYAALRDSAKDALREAMSAVRPRRRV